MRVVLLFVSLAIVGCGDTRDTSDGSVMVVMDSGPAAIDGSPPDPDGGSSDGGSPGPDAARNDAGPAAPTLAVCVLGCVTGADCMTPSPAFDENNYRCEAGACRYTGCVDDAECRMTFGSMDYVCRDPGTGVRVCLERCDPGVCGSGTAAFDADNYACESGSCRYLGCNNDAECEGTFGSAYGCIAAEPAPTPLPIPIADRNCVRRCTTVSDCATDSGAFAADNYECVGGACRYRGCNADAECETSLRSTDYICR